jgi:hypothetical protein
VSGHTPGPWHWDSDPVKGDEHGRIRYRVCTVGQTITQVYHSSYEGGLTRAEADARLIAAAPDLLATLRDVLGWIPDGGAWHTDAPMQSVAKARAAISKATGAPA